MAKTKSVSMVQVVREAIESQAGKGIDDETYRRDPAWKLLEAAREIGGSGCLDGAARLEEELYGPVTR